MIRIKYIIDGTKGELELPKLTSFESKEEILSAWGQSSVLDNYLVEDTLAQLKPEVDALAIPAVGGASSEAKVIAEKFGFTQLIATFNDKQIIIC